MILEGNSGKYQVGEKVAETRMYRVYICKDVATGTQFLLQIAAEIQDNGGLERAAFVLRQLKQTSDLFEAEHAKNSEGRLLSYDRLFPGVVDSFIATGDQGNRRVNILALTEVEDVKLMVPLSNLASKDHLRIALVSSAWVLGRLLKLLAFAHGEGIAVRALGGSNVLLEPERHFVIVMDWSSAQTYQEEVPREVRKDEIAKAAKTVIAAIGGDPNTGKIPYSDEEDPRYVECLWRLACRRESDAEKARAQFYELVDELWGREFRDFQTKSL